MDVVKNPHKGGDLLLPDQPVPSTDAQAVATLLARCPQHAVTPLVDCPDLATRIGAGSLVIKDERGRMGLGSFKALGAAYVIACDAQDGTAKGRTYVTASAGNHGMSVAAGARAFGAHAVVYIAETVPKIFATRLEEQGATVICQGADYQASMDHAMAAATEHGWTLLSDSSWPGYTKAPHRLMEGYLQLAAEAETQIGQPPTHVFLQAGVGGLACAVAAYVRRIWGKGVRVIVVEPVAAPALLESVRHGRVVDTTGPDSNMGRLDCKTPSMIALNGLARDADLFVTITDAEAADGIAELAKAGLDTSPSGGAGVVAAMIGHASFGIDASSRVMCILSEGPA